MKNPISPILVGGLLLLGATACKSDSGYTRIEDTASSMNTVADRLETVDTAITAAVDALQGIHDNRELDPTGSYDAFVTATDELETQVKRLGSAITAMNQSGESYFTAWEENNATLANETLRNRAEARRTAALERHAAAKDAAARFAESYETFVTGCDEVATYLGNDLNPAGIESISDVIENVTEQGDDLHGDLASLAEELKNFAQELKPVQVEPEPEDDGAGDGEGDGDSDGDA